MQLSSSMETCQSQFTFQEAGSSVADTERMLKNLSELKSSIEQTAEVVQSHGKKTPRTSHQDNCIKEQVVWSVADSWKPSEKSDDQKL